jgi:hypothetical protein
MGLNSTAHQSEVFEHVEDVAAAKKLLLAAGLLETRDDATAP